MNSTNGVAALTVEFSRFDLNNKANDPTLGENVQVGTADTERAQIWESETWRACMEGRSFDVESDLAKLNFRDLSRFVNARDRNGNTALIVASAVAHGRKKCKSIISILLAAGADINTKNQDGRTALMEASLRGGRAAVEVLLNTEQGGPADVNMRDNLGLRATDLAGRNLSTRAERRRSRTGGDDKGLLFDDERQRRIVELLDKFHDTNTASTFAHPKSTSTHADEKTDSNEDRIILLEVELLKLRNETKGLRCTVSAKEAELVAIYNVMKYTKQESVEQANKLLQARESLVSAKRQIAALSRRRSDKSLQFRVTKLEDGTLDTQIDIIRTLHYGPGRDFNTGVLMHSRPTIAYMEMNGHFARNGKHRNGDFIDSSYWATHAYDLFHDIGSSANQSWFQHTEPQLMALCVHQFLKMNSLTLDQFKDKKSMVTCVEHGMPEIVEILVSRDPCKKCIEHEDLVNKITTRYGFEFQLIWAKAN